MAGHLMAQKSYSEGNEQIGRTLDYGAALKRI